MKIKENIDLVIVGTSPVCLIEGVYQTKLGKKVCILEKKNKIGGAWHTMDMWGFKGLETGCHVFFPKTTIREDKVTDFVKRKFDVNMKIMAPKPLNYYEGEYSRNSELNHIYPSCGHYELLANLQKVVKEEEIEIYNNIEVKKVKSHVDHVQIDCLQDETNPFTIKVPQAILPAHIHLENIENEESEKVDMPYDLRDTVHCSILLEDNLNKDFSHIDIKSGIIDRLSLNRGLANPEGDKNIAGKLVMCARIRRNLGYKLNYDESTVERIMDFIEEMGIVEAHNKKALDYQFFFYKNFWRTPDQYSVIKENLPNNVTVMYSTDLLECINNNIDRWNEVL